MTLNTSYKQILAISIPIMLGGAAQNIIALSDSVFLYHLSELDFAAIGFVSVFYLIIAAIGFSFSKGGQIIVARRFGEQEFESAGRSFYAMLYFEFALSIIMFLFMFFGASWFFEFFIKSEAIYTKSLEYLNYRSYGVFFSYVGIGFVAFFTGIAKTKFIIYDTLVLVGVNIVLNYSLIYGKFGLPEMGIAGAGLASTIAEICAFIMFLIYLITNKSLSAFKLNRLPKIDFSIIKNILGISSPVVAQSIVGLGSWFIFFSLVEDIGERELAMSNLARTVYLILSIPTWGYASGVNTLVSHFIGRKKRNVVMPIIHKTTKITLLTTLVMALPFVLFPAFTLYPLFGGEDMSLMNDTQPIFYIVFFILITFSIGGIYFNGLAGTGATLFGLQMQTFCSIVYLSSIYLIVKVFQLGLYWAWSIEFFYWALMYLISMLYLRSNRWHSIKV
ncbi:MAG: MATE family efflux transporter [Bacteroidota bacterium]